MNIQNKNTKSQENVQLRIIQENKEKVTDKLNIIKNENNNEIIEDNKDKIDNKPVNNITNNNGINHNNQGDMNADNINNINKHSMKNNDNIKENNNNIRSKYYTEIISSNNNLDNSKFNPFSITTSSIMHNYTNVPNVNESNQNNNINNNLDKKVDQDYISFSLKNIKFTNSVNNLEIDHNTINKRNPLTNDEINKIKNEENYQNILNNNNTNNKLSNNIIDLQIKNNIISNDNNDNNNIYLHSKKSGEKIIKDNDEFKEFLLSENKNLKKEINIYEQLINPLINYINDINRKLEQRIINPRDIKTIVKSNNSALYINNLEKHLNSSKNEINNYIDQMKIKLDQINKKHEHKHYYHKRNKSNYDNYINNIKTKRLINSDDEDDINFQHKSISNFNFGKGNFFYEDKNDKYFYNYYLNRSINCPACIIGNSNSERGFSPVICSHLKTRRFMISSEEESADNDNNISEVNKIKN